MDLSQEVGSIQNFHRKPITTWDFPGGTWGSNIHKGAEYKYIIPLSMYREKFYQLHVAQCQLGQPLHILETAELIINQLTIKIKYLSMLYIRPILKEKQIIEWFVFCPSIFCKAFIKPVLTG